MISSVEEYLAELKNELAGADRATIQDALSDAEEYLRTALSNPGPGIPAGNLTPIIEKYGTPSEIAAAYKHLEWHTPPSSRALPLSEPPAQQGAPPAADRRPLLIRFFGVFAEPRTWGAFLYLLLALVTGIIYFTWAVTGLSVSFSLLILIIGLPIAALFLLSIRGIALVEGRLVEALLGVRMPRRPRFTGKSGLWQHFKNLVTDKHTWFSMIYMLLQLPLGIFYFTLLVTLVSLSLGIALWPIIGISLGLPVFVTPGAAYYATGWLVPVGIICGGLLLTATMHLAKGLGKAHGSMARAMLVRL